MDQHKSNRHNNEHNKRLNRSHLATWEAQFPRTGFVVTLYIPDLATWKAELCIHRHFSAQEDLASHAAMAELISQVKHLIGEAHNPQISWHCTLDNHASIRPKEHGGPLVRSVSAQ